ncbi:MAG: CPBP family intramembrane metalloprotease [Firmicutes bacterium]|nr:CPBP family intramembrane metalloprotease [Bacillota bacterium]
MQQPLSKLRIIWKPLQLIGAVYLIYFVYQTAFLLLGQILGQLLNLPLELGKVSEESPLSGLLTYLFLGLFPLILAFFTTERYVFRKKFLPRFFPYHPIVLKDILFGLLLGLLLFSLLFFTFKGIGWIEVTRETVNPFLDSNFYFLILTFFTAALFEELLYRGLHLPVFAACWGLPAGIAFSSFLFSLGHLNNPNLGFLGLIGILTAGILFATAYLLTGSLHLAVSLHFSWNLCEALFGFQVSGLSFLSFFSLKLTGPELWTGGAFGPEGGLSGIGLMLLGTVAVFLYAKYGRGTRTRSRR